MPVDPLDRLALFSPADFERFTLEWASDYLSKVAGAYEVQQRGGSGDKGRDIVVWWDPPSAAVRDWSLYQCKHYDSRLGQGTAAAEVAKVLFYTWRGDYRVPREYWFVTHAGVTSDFQDLLDDPAQLKKFVLDNWDKYCASKIRKNAVPLTQELKAHIDSFDFSIFRAKQPIDLLKEHQQTRYHLVVFGAPLIERPPPKQPPSEVEAAETIYVSRLYEVISEAIGKHVSTIADFADDDTQKRLFDRSRITFYFAEGLKELARDQMADQAFFDTLLEEFSDGLYHTYTAPAPSGLERLRATIQAAQALQISGHVLEPHLYAKDREGMCHQLSNEGIVRWCNE